MFYIYKFRLVSLYIDFAPMELYRESITTVLHTTKTAQSLIYERCSTTVSCRTRLLILHVGALSGEDLA
jgi:hypothetical protein